MVIISGPLLSPSLKEKKKPGGKIVLDNPRLEGRSTVGLGVFAHTWESWEEGSCQSLPQVQTTCSASLLPFGNIWKWFSKEVGNFPKCPPSANEKQRVLQPHTDVHREPVAAVGTWLCLSLVMPVSGSQLLRASLGTSTDQRCLDIQRHHLPSLSNKSGFWDKSRTPGWVISPLSHGWKVLQAINSPFHQTELPGEEQSLGNLNSNYQNPKLQSSHSTEKCKM
jgi:hypothetical protein